MERFYLELPSIERKEEALAYIQEFKEYNSNINGTGGLNRYLEKSNYEEWLDNTIKGMEKEYAESKGLVQSATYFTIREEDNKIVGMISLRYYLNDYLRHCGGHIGYSIRPTERRNGYAKIQLYMGLLKAKKINLDKVMVDCIDTNIGSEKTIQALGGEFEGTYYDEESKETLKNYWINVDKSIEKYRDLYGKYVLIKKM